MTTAAAPPALLLQRQWDIGAQQRLRARAIPSRNWGPQEPTERQHAFLALPGREALYGGAAGGGKSSALLMAALQYVHVPGYAALLLRRTFPDLAKPGAIMDRSKQWLSGTGAQWNGNSKTWTFPSGALLTFGYLEHEDDKLHYQSAEYQFIGFDELTQFSETQYRYLFSRLRRLVTSDVPLRMRAASNPGGPGHEWVKQRFLVEGATHDRAFVPARLADNPYLDREEYLQSLAELDAHTRAQLERGDWDALPAGQKFKRSWFTIVEAAPAHCQRVRFWDLAATEAKLGHDPDWTAGVLLGRQDGIYTVIDVQRLRGSPLEVEQLIKQTAQMDGIDTPVYMEQEPGASGVTTIDHYRRVVLDGFAFHGVRSTGAKELRANPVSSAAQAGNVRLVRGPWIGTFLDELCSFPSGAHDDQVDALSGAHAQLAAARGRVFAPAVGPPRPPLPHGIR